MMSYRAAMENCVIFIDSHIGESINASTLADITGYSLYHFCHVFRAYFDMSVGEYVRCRSLQKAVSDILTGKPITAAAFDSGFSTSAGFSKAFKKQYGISATEYRRQYFKRSSDNMDPAIIKKDSFSAVGYNITPKDGNNVDILEAGAYWCGIDIKDYAKCHMENSQNGEIGLWIHPDCVSGELRYFFGYITDTDQETKSLEHINIPAADYAVFDVPTVSPDIHGGEKLALEICKMWKYIFKEWLDRSKYIFDEDKMCFEFYHGRDTQIYVPIKRKN
jgi:AraC family transcriptional regulator